MSQYKLNTRSLQNLSGVHPDLVAIVEAAIKITKQDFIVIEGVRNINRQRELFKSGKSKTMNSRHLTGHAVDICPYPVDWNDKEKFEAISDAMKDAAKKLKVSIEWGGDWKNAWDKPHYQLTHKDYPA
jgi:peptidoglycan L-alanyl-D-glutamate endopeptidase CwlK